MEQMRTSDLINNGFDAEGIHIRALTFSEFELLVDLAKNEGWNPGIEDARIFWNTDSEGFLGCFMHEALIGGGSVVSYNGAFGFMGFFIVKPEYRSVGIGRKLWFHRRDYLLKRLNNGATIGMDGVVAMQDFYAQGGFQIAFRDERYQFEGKSMNIHENVSKMSVRDWPEIRAYDQHCFGFDRTGFLQLWLNSDSNTCFVYRSGKGLGGFANTRKTVEGYKIGPLFAKSKEIAEELFKACLNAHINEAISLDIPCKNIEAVELVKKYNGQYIFECGRMYYGSEIQIPISEIFGITSFELG